MRLNTYSKIADSAYRDYPPNRRRKREPLFASLSHPLSGRAEEDLAYPRLSVNPGIIQLHGNKSPEVLWKYCFAGAGRVSCRVGQIEG